MLIYLQLYTFGKFIQFCLNYEISVFSSFIIMPLDFDNNYDSSKPKSNLVKNYMKIKNFHLGHVLDEMAKDPELKKELQFGMYKRAV